MGKLVESSALRPLTDGSYESIIGELVERVRERHESFGARFADDVGVLSTYPSHCVVVTRDGGFYRCGWSGRPGSIQLGLVERLDVPVADRAVVTDRCAEAVRALLEGSASEARRELLGLFELAAKGVPLTPAGAAHRLTEWAERADGSASFVMVSAHMPIVRKYLGPDVLGLSVPAPLLDDDAGQSDGLALADVLKSACSLAYQLEDKLWDALEQLSVARESGVERIVGADGAELSVDDIESMLHDLLDCLQDLHDTVGKLELVQEEAGKFDKSVLRSVVGRRRMEPFVLGVALVGRLARAARMSAPKVAVVS